MNTTKKILNLLKEPLLHFLLIGGGLFLIFGWRGGPTSLKEGTGILGLLGIMTIQFILVALTSAFVVSLKKPWTRIVVRVTGSWIFASGLLMIGWIIHNAKRG